MASFAPGTSKEYINNYYRTVSRALGGEVPDDLHPYGVRNTGNQPAHWYSQPSRAQPQQSPWSTSTPYSPNKGQPFGAWSPQPAAGAPQQQQPPPFQAQTLGFDGTQSQMPNFQQRDAFIAQINNQLGQMQQQSWQQPGMGAPQFNFPQMWGQAGQMVQQGWQNPFVQQSGFQQPQDPGAAIRGLLQGYNIPQNVMDQIGGLPTAKEKQAAKAAEAERIRKRVKIHAENAKAGSGFTGKRVKIHAENAKAGSGFTGKR